MNRLYYKLMEKIKTERPASGPKKSQGFKINSNYIYLAAFFILTIAYLIEAIIPKPDKLVLQHYHLSTSGYYWLVDPLVSLLTIIWLVSLYGALKVKSYSRLIKDSPDGLAINRISNGLMILTISLPIISNISYVLGRVAKNHPSLQPTITIIINYISLGLMALAFIFISLGSYNLYQLVPGRVRQLPHVVWQGLFILFSSVYSYFLVSQPIHAPLAKKVYYLPGWLLVLTIAVPYMFFWYLGVRGAYNIYLYRRNINGRLYKNALDFLAVGIAVVVLGSVLTRVITSSSSITNLRLTAVLLIVYGLLTVIAAGYILIAIGAKKLRSIEEA